MTHLEKKIDLIVELVAQVRSDLEYMRAKHENTQEVLAKYAELDTLLVQRLEQLEHWKARIDGARWILVSFVSILLAGGGTFVGWLFQHI